MLKGKPNVTETRNRTKSIQMRNHTKSKSNTKPHEIAGSTRNHAKSPTRNHPKSKL